ERGRSGKSWRKVSGAWRRAFATAIGGLAKARWKRIIRSAVLDASTGHSEPTTDPAPPIKNADVRPRTPIPSREFPIEESQDDRTTTALFASRCCATSTAVTLFGPERLPSRRIDDRRGSTASV